MWFYSWGIHTLPLIFDKIFYKNDRIKEYHRESLGK